MRVQTIMIVVAAAAAGACGDATAPGVDMSTPEVEAVTNAVVGAVLTEGLSGSMSPSEAAVRAVPVNLTFNVNRTVECEGGGTMALEGSIAGTVDSETGAGSLGLQMTQTLSACGLMTAEHGEFTVSGDPNIVATGDLAWGPQGPEPSSFGYTGGFTWTHEDGRSGACSLDVSISWSGTSASYQGSVCGQTMDVTITTS